jgi:putative restriction endonuclease
MRRAVACDNAPLGKVPSPPPTDAERLDAYNGLLLAAHLDAAFDAGLISFADDGAILSSQFTMEDRDALGIHDHFALCRVGARHLPNLAWHRTFLLGS